MFKIITAKRVVPSSAGMDVAATDVATTKGSCDGVPEGRSIEPSGRDDELPNPVDGSAHLGVDAFNRTASGPGTARTASAPLSPREQAALTQELKSLGIQGHAVKAMHALIGGLAGFMENGGISSDKIPVRTTDVPFSLKELEELPLVLEYELFTKPNIAATIGNWAMFGINASLYPMGYATFRIRDSESQEQIYASTDAARSLPTNHFLQRHEAHHAMRGQELRSTLGEIQLKEALVTGEMRAVERARKALLANGTLGPGENALSPSGRTIDTPIDSPAFGEFGHRIPAIEEVYFEHFMRPENLDSLRTILAAEWSLDNTISAFAPTPSEGRGLRYGAALTPAAFREMRAVTQRALAAVGHPQFSTYWDLVPVVLKSER